MSTKLYKNTEGKVLMSIGNKLIKQPYEFGVGYQGSRMGLENSIIINKLIDFDHTIVHWFRNYNSTIAYPLKFTDVSLPNTYICSSLNTQFYFSYGNNASPYMSSTGNALSLTNTNLIGLNVKFSDKGNSKLNTNSSAAPVTYTASNFNSTKFDSLTICGKYSASFDTSIHSRFTLFNRTVTDNELKYYYNNRIGNEFQTTSGIIIDMLMNKAEVINILGVDQPCIRDYSGNNNHGIIQNLPAGTAQQKVDYANANLFVPFQ